jgi:hypothetical protein
MPTIKQGLDVVRHKYNLSGRGIKIAIHEFSVSDRVKELVKDLNVTVLDVPDISNRWAQTYPLHGKKEKLVDAHAYMTCRMIRDILPKAELYLTLADVNGIAAAREIKPHLANFSVTGAYAADQVIVNYSKETFIFWAAGNSGEEGEERINRLDDVVTTVYAWKYRIINNIPTFTRASYSSFGHGWGDIAGLTELTMSDGTMYSGTSAATPFVVGITAQYLQHHADVLGYYPSIRAIRDWIEFNGHDVGEPGWDEQSGYGLLKLPPHFELRETELQVGNNKAIYRKYRDGQLVKERITPVYVEPEIINGRALVGIRDVEALNHTVFYDAKTKKIKITK